MENLDFIAIRKISHYLGVNDIVNFCSTCFEIAQIILTDPQCKVYHTIFKSSKGIIDPYNLYVNTTVDIKNVNDNTIKITFNNSFNQDISALENLTKLTTLSFGHRFNQDISALENLTELTTLSFGYCFDQDI